MAEVQTLLHTATCSVRTDLDCALGTFTQVKTLTLLQKNFRRSPHARELELEGDSKNLFNHRGWEKERHLGKCKEFWGVWLWVSQRTERGAWKRALTVSQRVAKEPFLFFFFLVVNEIIEWFLIWIRCDYSVWGKTIAHKQDRRRSDVFTENKSLFSCWWDSQELSERGVNCLSRTGLRSLF